MRGHLLRRVVAVLAALVGIALAAGPAGAHAKLLGSAPADGATVTDALAAVILEFNEVVGAPEVTIAGPGGQPVTVDPPEAQDRRVVQPLPPLTQQGVYSVTYRVVSADKDPVSGQLAFTYSGPVQQEAQPSPPPAPAATPAPATAGEQPAEQGQAATPAPAARSSWPVALVAIVALLGVIGAAWYAFSRKGKAGP